MPIVFRDGELEEAGRELVSAARQIQALDAHAFEPIRNVKRQTCMGCPYRDICPAPENDLIDVLFERLPAKRDRAQLSAPTTQPWVEGSR